MSEEDSKGGFSDMVDNMILFHGGLFKRQKKRHRRKDNNWISIRINSPRCRITNLD